MDDFPADIYTEPADIDPITLRNLGPLTKLAGIWQGTRGLDVKVETYHDQVGYFLWEPSTGGEPTPNPLARAAQAQ
jgi:hypothetical protein